MPFIAECPNCKRRYAAGDDSLGKKARCTHCHATFEVLLTAPDFDSPAPDQPLAAGSPLAATDGEAYDVEATSVPRRPALSTTVPSPRKKPRKRLLGSLPIGGRAFWISMAILAAVLRLVNRFGWPPLPGNQPPVAMAPQDFPGQRLPVEPAAVGRLPAPQLTAAQIAALPQLATTPYALDDPVQLSRVADGVVTARFPERLTFRPFGPGVVLADEACEVAPDQPGHNGHVRVYRPEGTHPSKSLGCVLITTSGGTLITAGPPSRDVDEVERLGYVKAGFVVVAFEQDGACAGNAPEKEVLAASKKFFVAQAGLLNARHALEFALARVGEIDPARVYVAGHSSAGTLALLFAEHEHRIRGCIAYAPVTDLRRRWLEHAWEAKVAVSDYELSVVSKTSPSTHAQKLRCPILLFHSEQDPVVPVRESRQFAQQLQELGKQVDLVTVAGNDHYQDMIAKGIPRGIEWLQELEHPGLAEERKQRSEAQRLAREFEPWLKSVDELAAEVSKLGDATSVEAVKAQQLQASLQLAAHHVRILVPKLREQGSNSKVAPLELLGAEERQRIVDANQRLLSDSRRLRKMKSEEPQRGWLLASLDGSRLPAWVIEGRLETPAELEAAQKATATAGAAMIARQRNHRDFRADAARAMKLGKYQDALLLFRADLLVGDDDVLVKSVKWSPALKRPATHLQWGFGAELNGFPDTGPANLQAPPPLAPSGQRNITSEWKLSDQLKALGGPIGVWLAEGLQNRVDAGGFGDWGKDAHRGFHEHPGIVLLDFAPVETLVATARAHNADVLMALSLTYNPNDNGRPNTTLVVQLHDVESGSKLWESKALSNAKILSARRQGKDLAAELAEAVLQFIDDEILLRSIPKLPTAAIHERLEAILSNDTSNRLSALVELRYFEITGRIKREEAQERLTKILVEQDARRLISEDEDDRREAIEPLVPKSR